MRHTIRHDPPDGQQSYPPDNDSTDVHAQVWVFRMTGQLVHVQVAMEIAAWWQAPTGYGEDFLAFSSTGTITGDLLAAIDSEIAGCVGEIQETWHRLGIQNPDDDAANGLNALHALRAYVLECKVTPWLVGHNMAGYSPEADVYQTLDYESAYASFVDELDRLADHFQELTADHYDEEGNQTCGECEECSTSAFVGADHERYAANGYKPKEREISESYQIAGHRTDVYWLTKGEPMTYAEFLDAYKDSY